MLKAGKGDFFCFHCKEGGAVLCCSTCPRVFHKHCMEDESTGDEAWHCPTCVGAAMNTATCTLCGRGMVEERLLGCHACPRAYHYACAQTVLASPHVTPAGSAAPAGGSSASGSTDGTVSGTAAPSCSSWTADGRWACPLCMHPPKPLAATAATAATAAPQPRKEAPGEQEQPASAAAAAAAVAAAAAASGDPEAVAGVLLEVERLCGSLPSSHFASIFGSRLASIRWLEDKAGVAHTGSADSKQSPLDRLAFGHVHSAGDVQARLHHAWRHADAGNARGEQQRGSKPLLIRCVGAGMLLGGGKAGVARWHVGCVVRCSLVCCFGLVCSGMLF
jgi:hypothetical protein